MLGGAGCVANAEPPLVAGISNVPDTVRMDAKTIEAVYHDVAIVWEDGVGGDDLRATCDSFSLRHREIPR